MPNLTKTYISSLKSPEKGKQAFYWDDAQEGLGVRVTSSSKAFVFQTRFNGGTIRMALGNFPTWSVEQARARARELKVMTDKGIDPRQERKIQAVDATTLKTVLDCYIAERKLKPRTKADYRRYFEHYLSDWLDKPIKSIGAPMVEERHKKIAASSSGAAQASSAMRALRAVYYFAIASYGVGVMGENPVLILSLKKTWAGNVQRSDRLRAHHVKPWVEAVRALDNAVMAGYLEFILLTGARRSEAAKLQWKDVDFKGGVLTFRDTKNGEDREIPIGDRVGEILHALRPHGKKYVFAILNKEGKESYIKEPRKALAKANTAAEAEVTVHGLRRTFATLLESLDAPAWPVKALLGHSLKSDVTTGNYVRIDVERLRPWVAKYESYIADLLGSKRGNVVEFTGVKVG